MITYVFFFDSRSLKKQRFDKISESGFLHSTNTFSYDENLNKANTLSYDENVKRKYDNRRLYVQA